MSTFKAVVKGYISEGYMKKNVRKWNEDETVRVRKAHHEPRFGNQMAIALRKGGLA